MLVFDYTASYDVSEILSEVFASTEADAIINVSVVIKITPADYFVNLFTLGLANAKTVEVSGQAIRAPGGLGAISSSGAALLAESETLEDLTPMLLQGILSEGSFPMILRVPEGENGFSYQIIREK